MKPAASGVVVSEFMWPWRWWRWSWILSVAVMVWRRRRTVRERVCKDQGMLSLKGEPFCAGNGFSTVIPMVELRTFRDSR
jgi:hypothetical protein